jgi:hypothetical protein
MAKRASAKRTAPTKRTDMLEVPMHSVVHFVRMLHDEGHADGFAAAAKKSKATVALHPDAVNFVRKFLGSKQLHGAMAARVVDPCPGDPFRCNFRSNS